MMRRQRGVHMRGQGNKRQALLKNQRCDDIAGVINPRLAAKSHGSYAPESRLVPAPENVGAGTRHTSRCCSLIHRFSRLKNGRQARIQAVSANRLTRVIKTLEAPDGARLTAAFRLCGMRTTVYQSAAEPNPKRLPYFPTRVSYDPEAR